MSCTSCPANCDITGTRMYDFQVPVGRSVLFSLPGKMGKRYFLLQKLMVLPPPTQGPASSPVKQPPPQPLWPGHWPSPSSMTVEQGPGDTPPLIWAAQSQAAVLSPGQGGASVNLGPREQELLGQGPKTSHFTRMEFHDLCVLIKFLFLCNFS